ncbi:hypothetical protein [uncultured Roseibium sp.]|uniref:hypothetical protein n=1 Tax=uncultured Roseibium sp. TaxID=1936171 RepID=UPI00260D7318|nr:hypothetical protein [uncultured Roseibium sp.]
MAVFKMPDGQMVNFPDDMPNEQIRRLIAKKYPKEAADFDRRSRIDSAARERADFHNRLDAPGAGDLLVDSFTLGLSKPISGLAEGVSGEVGELFGGEEMDFWDRFDIGERTHEMRMDDARKASGGFGTAASIAGSLGAGTLAKAPVTASTGLRMLQAGKEGAVLAGIEGTARGDGNLGNRIKTGATDAAIGAGLSAGLSRGLDAMAQSKANKVFRKEAPDMEDLKASTTQAYDDIKSSGIMLEKPAYQNLGAKAEVAYFDEFNPGDYPQIEGILKRMAGRTGDDLSLHQLERYNQRLARIARDSADADKAAAAGLVRDEISDFMEKFTPNDLYNTKNPKQAWELVSKARGLAKNKAKTQILEDAIERGMRYSSGAENGIRQQFKTILNNKRKAKRFTNSELQLMDRIVKGAWSDNALKRVGKLGLGKGQQTNITGPALLLYFADALGLGGAGSAALGLAGASAARNASEAKTAAAADFARAMAASGKSAPVVDGSATRRLLAVGTGANIPTEARALLRR